MTEVNVNHHGICVALMRDAGIDAYEVVAHEIGVTGYLTRRKDAFGNTVLTDDNQGIVVDAHDWPKDFPVDEFMTHYNAWRKAERSA